MIVISKKTLLIEIGLTILIMFAAIGVAGVFHIITEKGIELLGTLSIVIILLGIMFLIVFYVVKSSHLCDEIKEWRRHG